MKERIAWVDIAKGFAILFVVVGHVVVSYHNAHHYEDSVLFCFSKQFVYSFHMPLFMMLSGLMTGMGIEGKRNNRRAISKLLAYGIPYVFFSFVWWAFKLLFSGHVNSTLSLSDILLIPLYPISFMWFLYALLIMVLIQMYIGGQKTNVFKCVHLLLALLMMCVQPLLIQPLSCISFNDLVISDVMKHYVFFLIGVYGFQYVFNIQKRKNYSFMIILGAVLVGGNVMAFYDKELLHSFLFSLSLAVIGSAFIMILSRCVERSIILEYLGRNSLAIYVLHGLCISVFRQGLEIVAHDHAINEWVAWGVCVFFGTCVPLIIYWLSTKVYKCDFVFTPTKYIRF